MRTDRRQLPATVTVHVPLKFTVRGGRKTIIGETPHQGPKTRFDDSIAKALARAHRWKQKLDDGTYATIGELAKAERINESYVTKILRFNLLAPDIVEVAEATGRPPASIADLAMGFPGRLHCGFLYGPIPEPTAGPSAGFGAVHNGLHSGIHCGRPGRQRREGADLPRRSEGACARRGRRDRP
mgnify:CR=1 FL=1